ncbi:hypothetical protein CEN41_09700 [Fischerella thermalis CCMEE 5330]|uniref:Uncharacterized protein n=1 Tax=Fischerella thermalis CCMEE 5330 TaxID=2019670 RepID=A0A2N6MDE3_9CYAN|nr:MULTISPECIES: hypothetical protein [Fischerella]PMB44781.1 hypothetical protein CEN41_09700 [Fischerella thermalis CCMEE 5330]BAU09009.1 hypothetical protein FIS3754_49680 [Fischerella sp. NIES-3754]
MNQEQQHIFKSKSVPDSSIAGKDTEQKSQETKEKVAYIHKTDRIRAWSEFIKSVTPYVWVAVIMIVLIPLLGKFLIADSSTQEHVISQPPKDNIVIVEKKAPPTGMESAIATAITNAHSQSQSFAAVKLDAWVDELMTRVDDSFLDWYFNYFNQKKLEFSTPFVWLTSAVAHWTNANNPSPAQAVAEKLTENFQTEFAKRVLRPKVAQLELENITKDTIDLYVAQLSQNIAEIQSSYKIPQVDWERYLGDIAITINDTEGNISNLSLKILTGGSAYLLTKAMIPTVTKVGSKVVTSFAGKAGAKMAAKTGGAVAAKLGAELLDPIVGVGIIIWDLWDYHHTVAVEKPILRDAIYDYLQQVKLSLLNNPENGIMSAINQVESGIIQKIHNLA